MDDERVTHATEHPELRRTLGPWLLLFFIVGDIVGGGIYALVGVVGGEIGGAIWAAFLAALILAAFTAASYVELVTKYPRAGGSASYIHRAFRTPFLSFMVAFAVVCSGLTSATALALAFGGDYLAQFVQMPQVLAALLLILVLALINFRGISESVKLNAAFTSIEIFGLLLIVLIGIITLATGTGEPARAFDFKEGSSIPLLILAGAALSFYALIGFDDSVNVAEEVRNPSRVYPRALFSGLFFAGIIYLLVTFTASMVVPTQALAASDGPLLEVVQRGTLPIPLTLFSVIALFAVSNGALINLIMASRLLYGMADQDVMPSVFSKVHPTTRTPWVSIIFTVAIVVVLLFLGGGLEALASATVVLLLSVFVLVNVSALMLRNDRVEHDHYRAPIVFPILGIVVSLALLTQQDLSTFVLVGILLLGGVVLYGVNVLVKRSLDRRAPRGVT
ncbi:MAG: APC family permease [Actinomycetota bacterium]|jgi:APA family basic amino acid/polyamine antiporter|nr:APC family permease [Actinomycetota bacterium]MDQ5817198.1 APC family permease [Actinomycetota bacterium]MDQ5828797.1 APC family permease [Actinomycetota bacterium]